MHAATMLLPALDSTMSLLELTSHSQCDYPLSSQTVSLNPYDSLVRDPRPPQSRDLRGQNCGLEAQAGTYKSEPRNSAAEALVGLLRSTCRKVRFVIDDAFEDDIELGKESKTDKRRSEG